MPMTRGRVNRGPAAAAQNRAAIVKAARLLFAEHGYRVPLSAIARAAGVGQGVLYRHFPDRIGLARHVFEDNFRALEEAAASGGAQAFPRLWRLLLEQTVREAAFVEMMVESRRTADDYDGGARLRELIRATLPAARTAGVVDSCLAVDDVLLAWRMAFGIVVTSTVPGEAERAIARANLLGLAPAGEAT